MNWLKSALSDNKFKMMFLFLLLFAPFWDVLIYLTSGDIHYMTTVIFWGILFLVVLPITYLKSKK